MTEEEADLWLQERVTSAERARLERFAALVVDENARQNLIAPASIGAMLTRHVVDSAQLLALAPARGEWVDIGTGAGFPGMVVGLLRPERTVLIEPRARRAVFLRDSAANLGAENIVVSATKAERVPKSAAAVISARAVASVDALLTITAHLRTSSTVYVLPRGRSGAEEVASVRARWHGLFHVERSVTDAQSVIIVATGVAPRCSASR